MLVKYVDANAFNTHNEAPNGAGGRRPAAPFGEGRPEAAPIVCSASIKSIGLRIFWMLWPPILLKALAIHTSLPHQI
jgi:hypothetical protein